MGTFDLLQGMTEGVAAGSRKNRQAGCLPYSFCIHFPFAFSFF
jgi:hypothetical protein